MECIVPIPILANSDWFESINMATNMSNCSSGDNYDQHINIVSHLQRHLTVSYALIFVFLCSV